MRGSVDSGDLALPSTKLLTSLAMSWIGVIDRLFGRPRAQARAVVGTGVADGIWPHDLLDHNQWVRILLVLDGLA